jgi:hypothetical protein
MGPRGAFTAYSSSHGAPRGVTRWAQPTSQFFAWGNAERSRLRHEGLVGSRSARRSARVRTRSAQKHRSAKDPHRSAHRAAQIRTLTRTPTPSLMRVEISLGLTLSDRSADQFLAWGPAERHSLGPAHVAVLRMGPRGAFTAYSSPHGAPRSVIRWGQPTSQFFAWGPAERSRLRH